MAAKKVEKAEEDGRKFTRKLPVKLTTREMAERAQQMLDKEVEIDKKKAEIAALTQPLRDDMKKLSDERAEVKEQWSKGFELRDVNCIERKDFTAGEVWIERVDTREEVPETRRTMTADERQEVFPSVGAKKKSKQPPVNDLDAENPHSTTI